MGCEDGRWMDRLRIVYSLISFSADIKYGGAASVRVGCPSASVPVLEQCEESSLDSPSGQDTWTAILPLCGNRTTLCAGAEKQ
jgi:hypothetical protein